MLLLSLPVLFLAAAASAYRPLSDETLRSLPRAGNDFDITKGALLAPILRPRVSGTEGNRAVLQHFVDFFRNELPLWTIELHNSTSVTPVSNGKETPFVNLIATRDPPGTSPGDAGRLALVAHYDSKLTPDGFIGATDSAAPCAMLMHMARTVDAALTSMWESTLDDMHLDEPKGLQILLLDGEEAFQTWSDADSLYGARALAADWESTYHPAMSTHRTPLDSIELFVLLDLLGSSEPRVPSYFKTTHWAYKNMAAIETRLRSLGLFKSSPNHSSKLSMGKSQKARAEPVFLHDADKPDNMWMGGFVQDDHVPFMKRGVDILHLIPSPFPPVWHEITDNGENLDLDTAEDWASLVTAFVGEWMELEGFFHANRQTRKTAVYGEAEKTEL